MQIHKHVVQLRDTTSDAIVRSKICLGICRARKLLKRERKDLMCVDASKTGRVLPSLQKSHSISYLIDADD